jgi:hypothetical protein
LIDLENPDEAEALATELYEKIPGVPLRTSFTVAATKVNDVSKTSQVRVSCDTSDRPDIFFGCLNPFSEIAKSPDVEVSHDFGAMHIA